MRGQLGLRVQFTRQRNYPALHSVFHVVVLVAATPPAGKIRPSPGPPDFYAIELRPSQQMEDEEHDTQNEDDVNESSGNVKCEKAKQPKNN